MKTINPKPTASGIALKELIEEIKNNIKLSMKQKQQRIMYLIDFLTNNKCLNLNG